jgi:hypothetical protein
VSGPQGGSVTVYAVVFYPVSPRPEQVTGFVESNGYVSIEAEHFTRAVDAAPVRWQRLPDLGRTLSAMTVVPVTAESRSPGGEQPRLEYRMQLFSSGAVTVRAYLSPTLNFHNPQGLRYAVSFDDEPPQIINMHTDPTLQAWEGWVANNVNVEVSRHTIANPGEHVLKFWMVDAGVVLQKLVVETGEPKPSYLGPPESYHRTGNSGTGGL